MGLPAKKPEDQDSHAVELSTDREQGLSKNFTDPNLEEMIPGLGAPSEGSVVEEAAAALQELVQNVNSGNAGNSSAIDLSASFAPNTESEPVEYAPAPEASSPQNPKPLPKITNPQAAQELSKSENSLLLALPKDSVEEPVSGFMFEGATVDTVSEGVRWEMAEKLFQLVLCERGFDDLVESAMNAIVAALSAQAGSVLELDQGSQDFFFRASIGGSNPKDKLKAFRVPMGKGIVGHVAESRQALLLRDLEEDKMQMKAISMSVGFEAKTCMAAPIVIGTQLYGVIEVFNKTDGGLFNETDLQVFEDGVRMIAKILEVRFLMAELVKRAG